LVGLAMNTNKEAWMQYVLKSIVLVLCIVFTHVVAASQTVRYQHTDMLGSVISESDSTGNIISRSHYEPFGKRIGGDKEGIGYTGHLQDKDLGLTYMQARYYDPLIGRFYSNDPLPFRDVHSFNRYAYANNNPYKYTDPTGEAAEGWMNRPGGVSIGQHQAAMGKAGGAAISRHPGVMVALATVKIVSLLNDSIEGAVDLEDDLAGKELIGEIEAGEGKVLEGMGDDQFDPETGTHDKVVKNRKNADGTQTEVHAERNRETQKVDKAKIKQDGNKSRENNR
jgi:RHS repeat-associated protein